MRRALSFVSIALALALGHAAARAEPPGASPPVEGDVDDPDKPPAVPAPAPAPPKGAHVRERVPSKDGMLRIPGGRFTLGSSDRTAPANERPARTAVVAPFWIDRTEVTVGAYRACVERGACPRPVRSSTLCTYDMGDPQLPVSCVPWSSAQAYCVSVGKRLPREVEWELAARGRGAIRYPWGGSASSCAAAVTLIHGNSQRSCAKNNRPSRVGTHPAGASPFGVLDMSGNVEEWVEDWYAGTVSDLSPRAGASHVLRGGGWLSSPARSRTTSRNWGSVREAGPNVGFRCARDDV